MKYDVKLNKTHKANALIKMQNMNNFEIHDAIDYSYAHSARAIIFVASF